MRKAFRQVPAHPESRAWGAFSVFNPEVQKVQLYQHLSLPFGARSAPLLFCVLSRILCGLAAFHLGAPIVAFADDFFAVVPSQVADGLFSKFKSFVAELLGFEFKTEKESPPTREGKLLGVWVTLKGGGNGTFFLPDVRRKT